jgi:quinoprotein glucose dehydrogenase
VYLSFTSPLYIDGKLLVPQAGMKKSFVRCLDAATGKRVWHQQLIHHGLWDYDPPAPPLLVTLTHKGRAVDAAVQLTKQGFVFVFDRVTGEPLFPVEERAVPPSDVPASVRSSSCSAAMNASINCSCNCAS